MTSVPDSLEFRIRSKTISVSSENPVYHQTIFDGIKHDDYVLDQKVPGGHDIVHLSLDEVPDELEALEIIIGGQKVHEVPASIIRPGWNVVEELSYKVKSEGQLGTTSSTTSIPILPLSRSYFMICNIVLRYNVDRVKALEVREEVDEVIEEMYISDEEIEFYTGRDVTEWGRRVHYKNVPTGKKVTQICKGADVCLPGIRVSTIKSQDIEVGIQSRVLEVFLTRSLADIDASVMKANKRQIVELPGGGGLARVGNFLRFQEGMSGLMWS